MILAGVVDWGKLLEAAYVSAVFGIGVVVIGGVAVVASLRSQDRDGAGDGQHAGAGDDVESNDVASMGAAAGIYIMASR